MMARSRPDALLTRRCRVCGCTDERACPGGCSWVEEDLCSACVMTARRIRDEVEAVPSPPGTSQAVVVITEVSSGLVIRTYGNGLAWKLAHVMAGMASKLRGVPGDEPAPKRKKGGGIEQKAAKGTKGG